VDDRHDVDRLLILFRNLDLLPAALVDNIIKVFVRMRKGVGVRLRETVWCEQSVEDD
jgi:hypothetical protein